MKVTRELEEYKIATDSRVFHVTINKNDVDVLVPDSDCPTGYDVVTVKKDILDSYIEMLQEVKKLIK